MEKHLRYLSIIIIMNWKRLACRLVLIDGHNTKTSTARVDLHKRKTLQWVLDCYGAYVSHLNALVRDTFVRVTDREKVKGNLKKWKDPNILVGTALYIELLKPAACLSCKKMLMSFLASKVF